MRALQYPGEKEITFPPFTCLETDGDPRVERGGATDDSEIIIFPLKVVHLPSPRPAQSQCPTGVLRPPFPFRCSSAARSHRLIERAGNVLS